jgi:hypothetical protein
MSLKAVRWNDCRHTRDATANATTQPRTMPDQSLLLTLREAPFCAIF